MYQHSLQPTEYSEVRYQRSSEERPRNTTVYSSVRMDKASLLWVQIRCIYAIVTKRCIPPWHLLTIHQHLHVNDGCPFKSRTTSVISDCRTTCKVTLIILLTFLRLDPSRSFWYCSSHSLIHQMNKLEDARSPEWGSALKRVYSTPRVQGGEETWIYTLLISNIFKPTSSSSQRNPTSSHQLQRRSSAPTSQLSAFQLTTISRYPSLTLLLFKTNLSRRQIFTDSSTLPFNSDSPATVAKL